MEPRGNMMRKGWVAAAMLCAAVLLPLLTGCGGDTPKLTRQDEQAFSQAAPELKQQWEKALRLDKPNDYAAAGAAFFSLLGQNLTPEQLQAVQTAAAAMNQKMYAAAAKGDAAAQKAIDALQTSRQPKR